MARPTKPRPPAATDAASRLRLELHKLRLSRGLTVKQLASVVGCSPEHVSKVELGKVLPGEALVEALDSALATDGLLRVLYAELRDERHSSRLALERKRYYSGRRAFSPPAAKADVHHEVLVPSKDAALPLLGDASAFLEDVTVPDGSLFRHGESFVKSWLIANRGTVPWLGRWLRRVGVPNASQSIGSPIYVAIPDTPPGSEVQIDVPCTAPALECTSVAYFKMVFADGRLCFPDRYPFGLNTLVVVPQDQ
jgi:transcriptional regulator with XRE-family HTH domain